jgi:hypothetical protein
MKQSAEVSRADKEKLQNSKAKMKSSMKEQVRAAVL